MRGSTRDNALWFNRRSMDAAAGASSCPHHSPVRLSSSVSNPQSPIPNPSHPRPRAFTLIEMLIVVTIMMILVTAAATMMRPATESRRTREAARAINIYLSSARNRAIETGRPCGVMLRHFGTLACALDLQQCAGPPAYCGDTDGAAVRVQVTGTTANTVTVEATIDPAGTCTSSLIAAGDRIQFNYQGPFYRIITVTPATGNATLLTAVCDISPGQMVPWPTAAPFPTVPYRIVRVPTVNTPIMGGAQPLQLPAGAVVDLYGSGIGINGYWGTLGTPVDVSILFAPNGSIESVCVGANQPQRITDPIFLLVGRRERIQNAFVASNPNPDTFTNIQDLTNLWIVINPQTGLVATVEVANSGAATTEADAVAAARFLARDVQSTGGK
jgi:prepilin-type N-terminal cleavage/methylation domain-containing protein